ncbi:MAG: hypothetical protein ACOC2U_03495, partial [bacterium]
MDYIIKFRGRKQGAIGKTYWIKEEIKTGKSWNFDQIWDYLYKIGYESIYPIYIDDKNNPIKRNKLKCVESEQSLSSYRGAFHFS